MDEINAGIALCLKSDDFQSAKHRVQNPGFFYFEVPRSKISFDFVHVLFVHFPKSHSQFTQIMSSFLFSFIHRFCLILFSGNERIKNT